MLTHTLQKWVWLLTSDYTIKINDKLMSIHGVKNVKNYLLLAWSMPPLLDLFCSKIICSISAHHLKNYFTVA